MKKLSQTATQISLEGRKEKNQVQAVERPAGIHQQQDHERTESNIEQHL